MVIATTGDALHAPRVRPTRLENALRRPMRDQCVIRAAFGHRRNHGRHDVLDSQVLGPDDTRRHAVLCTAGVWGGHSRRATSFERAPDRTGARCTRSYFRFAATFFAATFFFGGTPAPARPAPVRVRFRWNASIASTTGSES